MSGGAYGTERRLDYGHLIDRIFWSLLTAAALYVASQMRDMASNIAELNGKMSMLIERTVNQEHRLDYLEQKIKQ